MSSQWSIRWWDIAALLAAVAAGVLVLQYSLARGSDYPKLQRPAVVQVRLARVLPELAGLVSPGETLLDNQGSEAGRVVSLTWVAASGVPVAGQPCGTQDLMLSVRVDGALALARDVPGFPRTSSELKAGVFCLLPFPKVIFSGLITRVVPETLPGKSD